MKRVAALSLCALSCGGTYGSLANVDYARVLAVIADAPTVRPSERFTARAIVGGNRAEGAMRWTLCARPEQTSTSLPISSFGAIEADVGCDTRGALVLAESEEVAPSFVVDAAILTRDDVLVAAFGATIDAAARRSLAQRQGVALVLGLRWSVDGRVERAMKRIVVTEHDRNENPPAPTLLFDGVALRAGSDGRCVSDAPLSVARGANVRLTPTLDDATWAEEFSVIDQSGALVVEREQGFYSYYSTAGAWDFGRPRMPDASPQWTAPSEAATVTHWLVLRDGRGGTSGCRFDVSVR